MITAMIEPLEDVLEELKPLFEPHYAELGLNQDRVQLDPQYEVYLERARCGEVLCCLARERGRIVAYFVGFVAPALHYRRCLTLTMDIFWLHPDFRERDSLVMIEADMVSRALFEEVEREGRRRGVQRVYYGSKVHKDTSALFERMGMVEVDRYFSAWWGS
jgi:GNAT superfamily N-acetyltransferase